LLFSRDSLDEIVSDRANKLENECQSYLKHKHKRMVFRIVEEAVKSKNIEKKQNLPIDFNRQMYKKEINFVNKRRVVSIRMMLICGVFLNTLTKQIREVLKEQEYIQNEANNDFLLYFHFINEVVQKKKIAKDQNRLNMKSEKGSFLL
jgi:hypothetical protein